MLNSSLYPERESMSKTPLDRAYLIILEHVLRLEVEIGCRDL